MADKANINPLVFKWAREFARITEEAAAAKVQVSTEKLQEWEAGTSQPTIRQAQTLAKAYRRPFALFFLPEIPRDFQPLQDFRRKGARPLGTPSIFMVREIQQKQAWISEVNRENGEVKLPYVGRFSLKDNPVTVANDMLDTLGIAPSGYSTDNPVREWIDRAESKGIFVSRTSFIHSRLKLDAEELQGFVIADEYAPFVFINSDDWDAPLLFTLVHELAHIWIAETGISNEIEPDVQNRKRLHPVELFCNEVAANALMPADIVREIGADIFRSADEVLQASKRFGVSSFALLVRALNLELISHEVYRNLKRDADAGYREFLKREDERAARRKEAGKKGGPSYYLLQVNKNSRLFTRTVLDAYHGGFIEPTQASGLLNVHSNKFSLLEAQLSK